MISFAQRRTQLLWKSIPEPDEPEFFLLLLLKTCNNKIGSEVSSQSYRSLHRKPLAASRSFARLDARLGPMYCCAKCGRVFASKQCLQYHENSATACEKALKKAKFSSPTKQPPKQIVGKTVSPQSSSVQRPATSQAQTGAVNGPCIQRNPVVNVTGTIVNTQRPLKAYLKAAAH